MEEENFGYILRRKVKQYKKYGTPEVREKANDIFAKEFVNMANEADHGKESYCITNEELPDSCVNYFKHLCELNHLKFELKQKNYDYIDGFNTEYEISWRKED